MAGLQHRVLNRLCPKPRRKPVDQLRQMHILRRRPVQPGLQHGKRFNHARIQRDQIKAVTGVDPIQLALEQGVQMMRIAAGAGDDQINCADFAIAAIHRQMQAPAAQTPMR